MTCTTTTTRPRTSLPALLLAAREAEAEYRRINDSYEWACGNGYEESADRLWPEAQDAFGAWMRADEAYQRARIEATYPEAEG